MYLRESESSRIRAILDSKTAYSGDTIRRTWFRASAKTHFLVSTVGRALCFPQLRLGFDPPASACGVAMVSKLFRVLWSRSLIYIRVSCTNSDHMLSPKTEHTDNIPVETEKNMSAIILVQGVCTHNKIRETTTTTKHSLHNMPGINRV